MEEDEVEINEELVIKEKGDKPKLKSVTTVSKKEEKTFRHIFRDVFSGGDLWAICGLIGTSVILPNIKAMMLESVTRGFEQALYGEDNSGYQRISRQGGPVNYNNVYQPQNRNRHVVSPSREVGRKEADLWIIPSRGEAELVLDNLRAQIQAYGQATVADYYELIGKTASYTDNNWGWSDLTRTRVDRVQGGYVIHLPAPKPV